MYIEIKNHYNDNSTYVFKFNNEVYVINGCTAYKHSDEKVKNHIFTKHVVNEKYGVDIDNEIPNLTEDITREEIFYLIVDNPFNLLGVGNGALTKKYSLLAGVCELREWFIDDLDMLVKIIGVGKKVLFVSTVVNHKKLDGLPNKELIYILETITTSINMEMADYDDLLPIIDRISFDDGASLFKYDAVINIFAKNIEDYGLNYFYRDIRKNLESLVKFSNENFGEGSLEFVMRILNMFMAESSKTYVVLLRNEYLQDVFGDLFDGVVERLTSYIINYGGVYDVINDLYDDENIKEYMCSNDTLKKSLDNLINEFNKQNRTIVSTLNE